MSARPSPEALLADYARRIHLQDEDVDYLLSLLQAARGLGAQAGAVAEREACAVVLEKRAAEVDAKVKEGHFHHGEDTLVVTARTFCDAADDLRKRG